MSGGRASRSRHPARPATAQFLTADPLASQTKERYAYAHDDPLNGADPSGLVAAPGAGIGCDNQWYWEAHAA